MAKAKKKKRADHYEDKLKKGSSEDVINVSLNKVPETAIPAEEKKEEGKPVQKRKK